MIPRNRMDETKQDTDIPYPICNVSICDKCRKNSIVYAAVSFCPLSIDHVNELHISHSGI